MQCGAGAFPPGGEWDWGVRAYYLSPCHAVAEELNSFPFYNYYGCIWGVKLWYPERIVKQI